MTGKQRIKEICISGTAEEKRSLFGFSSSTELEKLVKKFELFSRSLYPRYFKYKSAPFHKGMVRRYLKSYRGENIMELAFRGASKTSLLKLVIVFVLLNDLETQRKYIKILSKDGKNSKQMVTDIYNLIVESREVYGNVFEKEGDKKREETMGSFTMKKGAKLASGTVGQTQRGHVQDAYRPDWIIFEDIEDRESISSSVITEGVIKRCDEAITGLSKDGSYCVNGNYISDTGTIEWFKNKKSVKTTVTPIMVEDISTWEIYSPKDIEELKADSDDFYGEYMCDPARSEDKFFDIDRVEDDLKNVREPKRVSAGVKYWAKYEPHHHYGAGSDHSEGIGLDANALGLFDFSTGELVVTHASNEISPDLSAHEYTRVCAEFGNCVWAPEVNNKCGGIVLTTAVNLEYPSIFEPDRPDLPKPKKSSVNKLGWSTNRLTKNKMFMDFRRDYKDGLIKIYDKEVLKEMKAYRNSDLVDKETGLITKHFDLLTAVVIAWQMKQYVRDYDTETGTSNIYENYKDGDPVFMHDNQDLIDKIQQKYLSI